MKFSRPIGVTLIMPSMSLSEMVELLTTLEKSGIGDKAEIDHSWIGTEITFQVDSVDLIECGDCSPRKINNDILLSLHSHPEREQSA
jgi:hypothetical protein